MLLSLFRRMWSVLVMNKTQLMNKYNIDRFLQAQEHAYPYALQELKAGRKRSHWIWYVFPQLKGLGRSYNSEYYGISGLDEAKAYLEHHVLG